MRLLASGGSTREETLTSSLQRLLTRNTRFLPHLALIVVSMNGPRSFFPLLIFMYILTFSKELSEILSSGIGFELL